MMNNGDAIYSEWLIVEWVVCGWPRSTNPVFYLIAYESGNIIQMEKELSLGKVWRLFYYSWLKIESPSDVLIPHARDTTKATMTRPLLLPDATVRRCRTEQM